MILVRSPLRITLGGGGTDLPSFSREHGGFCLTAAIDQYVYVSTIVPFEPGIYLKYSEMERVAEPQQIKHRILREVLTLLKIPPQIEITTLADIPAGTGLGSSSSFTTALLKAFRIDAHPAELAERACAIEIDRLKEPIGKQDQYAAAFGGLMALTILQDGRVIPERLRLHPEIECALEDGLLLFFTGYARSTGDTIREQSIDQLHEIKELGLHSYNVLRDGNLVAFGRLLNEHWQVKRQRSRGTSNDHVDAWYDLALKHGALGGKLVGAGGGGFLLFYTEDPLRLRKGLRGSGLQELRFRFEFEGTKVLIS